MKKSTLTTITDKEIASKLKLDVPSFSTFLEAHPDKKIIHILEKLGRLENGEIKHALLGLLRKKNEIIRALAIKNLAKIADTSLLPIFVKYATSEESTEVRREAASAIGRLKDQAAIPALKELLLDQDPKVVLQAIRGLLVFLDRSQDVRPLLSELYSHPNETIREIIYEEVTKPSSIKIDEEDIKPLPELSNKVIHGDTTQVLRHVPENCIHLTFTSPPYYNARDYSIYQSYEQYLQAMETVFKEVHRVTKEGRFFVLNTSPIIIPRISRSHASKRYPIPYDLHPMLVKMGWEFIDDIVWVKPEASVKNRNAGFLQHRKPLAYKPNTITEMLMVYRKKTSNLIDWNIRQYPQDVVEKSKVEDGYETTNVWHIDPTFDKVHSAVFPIDLCNRVIKYYSFAGDLVLDPFGGSGTLGHAARRLDRKFLLIEKEEKYIRRIKETYQKEGQLFSACESRSNFLDASTFIETLSPPKCP